MKNAMMHENSISTYISGAGKAPSSLGSKHPRKARCVQCLCARMVRKKFGQGPCVTEGCLARKNGSHEPRRTASVQENAKSSIKGFRQEETGVLSQAVARSVGWNLPGRTQNQSTQVVSLKKRATQPGRSRIGRIQGGSQGSPRRMARCESGSRQRAVAFVGAGQSGISSLHIRCNDAPPARSGAFGLEVRSMVADAALRGLRSNGTDRSGSRNPCEARWLQ